MPIIVSAFGPQAAKVAARCGDGLWTTGNADEIVERWTKAGGEGPVYSQMTLCWGDDRDKAVEEAHRRWRNSVVAGQLSQDLPTPTHFDQAASIVTPEMVAEAVPCGPDTEAIIKQANERIEAGVDHLYFHQIGDDQAAFLEAWRSEIQPALEGATTNKG